MGHGDGYLGGGNSNIVYFHSYLGRWFNLTNMFQRGWNHQLVICFVRRIPNLPAILLSRIFGDPLKHTSWGSACRGSKQLLTRYLEDFGRLGYMKMYETTRNCFLVSPSGSCDNLWYNLVMVFPRGQVSYVVGMLIHPDLMSSGQIIATSHEFLPQVVV